MLRAVLSPLGEERCDENDCAPRFVLRSRRSLLKKTCRLMADMAAPPPNDGPGTAVFTCLNRPVNRRISQMSCRRFRYRSTVAIAGEGH